MEIEYQYVWFQILFLAVSYIGFAYLLALSILVRDTELIVNRPFVFTIELLLMTILPGIPMMYFVISRNLSWGKAWVWFVSTSVQFGIFHVLFQLSGIYTWLFS